MSAEVPPRIYHKFVKLPSNILRAKDWDWIDVEGYGRVRFRMVSGWIQIRSLIRIDDFYRFFMIPYDDSMEVS